MSLVAVRKSSTGETTATSRLREKPASTITGSRAVAPVTNASASSTGRTVAEQPIRCGRGSPASCTSACSRSSESARWAPRLLPSSAWTSSTMTKRARDSAGRKPAEVNKM